MHNTSLPPGRWLKNHLNRDRAKAEALFEKAMKKDPREFWHWVAAGASYLGVKPQ